MAGGEQSLQVGKHQQKGRFYLCAPAKVHLNEFVCVLVSGRTGSKLEREGRGGEKKVMESVGGGTFGLQ